MSLSFPASPSNGTTYQGWIFQNGAWQSNPAAIPGVVSSFNGRSGAVTLGASDIPGNRILISSQTVTLGTPVAEVDFFHTFDNTYDQIEFDIYNVQVSAAGANLIAQNSWDGSTWDITANGYQAAIMYAGNAASTGGFSYGSFQGHLLSPSSGVSTVTTAMLTVRMRIAMPWVTDRYKYVEIFSTEQQTGVGYAGHLFSVNNTANGLNQLKGMRFLMTTGNITRGVFNLFGIAKSGAGGS